MVKLRENEVKRSKICFKKNIAGMAVTHTQFTTSEHMPATIIGASGCGYQHSFDTHLGWAQDLIGFVDPFVRPAAKPAPKRHLQDKDGGLHGSREPTSLYGIHPTRLATCDVCTPPGPP